MECEFSIISKIENDELPTAADLFELLKRVKPIFDAEPNIIDITGPVTVVSDIHGQLYELMEIFKIGGPLPANKYLFLGDIVDRGYHSIECISYLFCLKERYPNHITILRGTHESAPITQVYGFYDEVQDKYDRNQPLWRAFCHVFDLLPIAAVVDKKVFCIHGGISPLAPTLADIQILDRKHDIAAEGPITDLLYSVPGEQSGFTFSPRGAGNEFGGDTVDQFLKANEFELMIQSSFLREAGAEFIFDGKLLKLFSATNYCYRLGNRGAIVLLWLDADGKMQTKISFVPDSPKTAEFLEKIKIQRRLFF